MALKCSKNGSRAFPIIEVADEVAGPVYAVGYFLIRIADFIECFCKQLSGYYLRWLPVHFAAREFYDLIACA